MDFQRWIELHRVYCAASATRKAWHRVLNLFTTGARIQWHPTFGTIHHRSPVVTLLGKHRIHDFQREPRRNRTWTSGHLDPNFHRFKNLGLRSS